jgi:hypothetical protein
MQASRRRARRAADAGRSVKVYPSKLQASVYAGKDFKVGENDGLVGQKGSHNRCPGHHSMLNTLLYVYLRQGLLATTKMKTDLQLTLLQDDTIDI